MLVAGAGGGEPEDADLAAPARRAVAEAAPAAPPPDSASGPNSRLALAEGASDAVLVPRLPGASG